MKKEATEKSKPKVTEEKCRHAKRMFESGMRIQEVANILGHEKLDTTMKYVVMNKDDVKADYRRYA